MATIVVVSTSIDFFLEIIVLGILGLFLVYLLINLLMEIISENRKQKEKNQS